MTDELWAVHHQGSDDIIPTADREAADELVAFCDADDRRHANDPVYPRHSAVVIAWPGTADEHAAALEQERL